MSSPPPVRYVEIPSGRAGTVATLEAMADFARRAASDPTTGEVFSHWARAIVRGAPSKDYVGELDRLFHFVRENVRYRMDPVGLERVQTPYWTLLVDGAGDCDDHATLLAGLALTLGHGAALRAVKVDPSRPDSFSHVYALLGARVAGEDRWYGADTTQPHSTLGWEPPESRQYGAPLDLVLSDP